MRTIVMLVTNAYRPDPRLEREATALIDAGNHVQIIAWDRKSELPANEIRGGINIQRIHSIPSTYGAGWRQLRWMPRYWQACFQMSLAANPDVVHCHDLDTLYAGVQVKQKTGCILIYDAHEDYPALMSLYLPRIVVKALTIIERLLITKADLVITASKQFEKKLNRLGIRNTVTIGNYQPLQLYDQIDQNSILSRRKQLGFTQNALLITYIGGFSRNRLLHPLLDAAETLTDMHFLFWGDGHQKNEIEQTASHLNNVHYYGWLPLEMVPLHILLSDIIYYCLRSDYPGAIYNAPNTLAATLAAGKPIIANNVGDLGKVVRQEQCGILLDEVNKDTIREAILRLSNTDLRATLGLNGRKAAEREYNWANAASRLVDVYNKLDNQNSAAN